LEVREKEAKKMLQTAWAVVREGKIELVDDIPLPEGAKVIVTLLTQEDESQFWLSASERSLAEIWENAEDDIYAKLLQG
jgi:hypothetical protein